MIELHQSDLRSMEECPARSDLHLQGKTGYAVPLFQYGLRLHAMLEQYGKHCTDMGFSRDDQWADACAEGISESRLAAAVRKFPLNVILRPGFSVETEREFEVMLEHCVYKGRIDRLEYNPEAQIWRVIDYKSGFKPEHPERVPRQLLLYAAAIDKLHGKDGDTYETWLVFPEANPNIPLMEWTLTRENLESVLFNLDLRAKMIAHTPTWPATPGEHCRACPYLCADCPLNGEEALVVNSEEECLFVWQQQQHLKDAVKAWTAAHGHVDGIGGWTAPKSEAGYTVAGRPRSKEKKANETQLLSTIMRLAAIHPELVDVRRAAKLDSQWLTKQMVQGGVVADAIAPLVVKVHQSAVFKED